MASYRMALQELDYIAEGNSIPKEVLGIAGIAPGHDIDTFYDMHNAEIPVYMSGSGSVVWAWNRGDEVLTYPKTTLVDNNPTLNIKGKKADLIVQDELWTCPYCYALNYVKVGHCHHCAGPRR